MKATEGKRDVVVNKTVTEEYINLEISLEEAQFLADVMSKIAGNVELSRRKHANDISDSLGEVGIYCKFLKESEKDFSGEGLYFK